MDPTDLSGISVADHPCPSESDQGTFGDASLLSPKLRDKLSELAKWRIDPSQIEFPDDASEFQGGYATVSRALFTRASAARANLNESKNVGGGPNPRDGPMKKKVIAVKKLKTANEKSSERILESALEEAGFLVGLSHGHIIKLKGFVEDLPNGRIWLIFPWQEHGHLKNFVASRDWEIPERISLISDVTYGVQYLHSRNPPISHGDLKSINILVNSRCRAIITDFGSARRLTKKDADLQIKRTEISANPELEFQATFCTTTNTMTFTGNQYTLRWAAPELLRGDKPGLPSDIWALGWIFYEVMTNSVPFENLQRDCTVIKHVIEGNLPSVTDHMRMSLILQLCSVMVKCWTIDPTKRPTAEDCRKSLNWMPMVVPVPQSSSDQASSQTSSPDLLMMLGNMYKAQNDSITASKLYTEALNIYTEISNNEGVASALFGLGQVHSAQSEYNQAMTSYAKALEISTNIGDSRRRSDALWGLATVRCVQEEYSKAITQYSKVIQISTYLNDEGRKAEALRGLADAYGLKRDYDEAVTYYSEALNLYSNVGNMFGRAITLASLATVLRNQAKYSEAIALLSESLQISTDIGNNFGRAFALEGLADVHRCEDRDSDALGLSEEAAEIFKRIGHTENATIARQGYVFALSRIKEDAPFTPPPYTPNPDTPNTNNDLFTFSFLSNFV